MNEPLQITDKIAIIGLGYVGLPLAVALAKHHTVMGYDINAARVAALQNGMDATGEVAPEALRASALSLTSVLADLRGASCFIITVPTPVNANHEPDLSAVRAASLAVAQVMNKGALIVLESTVYPGVTEDVVGGVIAEATGLTSGEDFFLGYSPERINPGDTTHRVDVITKVIAGQTPNVTARMARIYEPMTTGGVFRAASIKVAEAAKVIENAQRDINIAFINEITQIFHTMGLPVYDVLAAARTKWNFLPFTPGLVGGHCIGVDPYYLASAAHALGYTPAVILAGRKVNDGMGAWLAERLDALLGARSRVLILGLTFKENVPDLRNSRVYDVYARLQVLGHEVVVHDALANAEEARAFYGAALVEDVYAAANTAAFDVVMLAVTHAEYLAYSADDFARLLKPHGLLADIKGALVAAQIPAGAKLWQLG